MLEYFRAMEDLGHAMLPLYAMALGLPHDYFNDLFTDPCWISRNVHYPPVDAEEGQFGIAPHTDHGFITLLPINEVPGLQVQARDGVWISAGYIENAIIVNSGDFMASGLMADLEQRPTGSFHPLKIDIYRLCSTIQTGTSRLPLCPVAMARVISPRVK